ncbi:MAG: dihydrodipicolinate synthase family protein [Burkholderiales bacterium]|nr:dihydrodipicolinate synthase family protein [Burkholderiales bacterium]MCW5603010.1 dihydrodipicolinate synthase family protein [Burkholderiales bacterium]
MIPYKKADARAWAKDNMKGVANVVIPSFSSDLTKLNEKGIRHDLAKELELGFWGTLLVSEVAITVPEYRQFFQWSKDMVGDKLVLIHHAGFNTLAQNIEAVKIAEKEGAQLVLLAYPQNFYPTTAKEIYDYTKSFCDATDLGVILFSVPHWGFERIHPAGMPPELIAQMIKDIPNIVCVKSEGGNPTPSGFIQTWKRHSHEVVVTFPVEAEALPYMGLIPMQFMGTSNSEYYGAMIPKMFNLAHDGKFEEMMELYWQLHPARMAYKHVGGTFRGGIHVTHRTLWKYMAWLQGFNGGPLRQPALKVSDSHMRQLREASRKSGLNPTPDPDSQYFIGRNPV